MSVIHVVILLILNCNFKRYEFEHRFVIELIVYIVYN